MRKLQTVLAGVVAMVVVAGMTAPVANARVGLTIGSKLYFVGGGSCSLGFFATNDEKVRLAVTAGHCADDASQEVVSQNGSPIGFVGFWMPDNLPAGLFGVSVIRLYNNTYTADAYFPKYGNPSVGDYVKKYGARTDKTEGNITEIEIDPDYPRYSRMEATMVGLPGDSGSAWVGSSTAGPKLLGLNVGHTVRRDGGYGYAIGFPISSLIKLVRTKSDSWGQGFIPVGP